MIITRHTAHSTRHTASQSKPNSEEAKIDLTGRAITVKAIQLQFQPRPRRSAECRRSCSSVLARCVILPPLEGEASPDHCVYHCVRRIGKAVPFRANNVHTHQAA